MRSWKAGVVPDDLLREWIDGESNDAEDSTESGQVTARG